MNEPGSTGDTRPEYWADPAATYDKVAEAYAAAFLGELDHKPFDRAILTRFAKAVPTESLDRHPVCDLGCGPGQVGAFLAGLGIPTEGVDLSIGMVEQARVSYPHMTFVQGDMTALNMPDGSFTAIVCFYALIHISRTRIPVALDQMRRVLIPSGGLLVAVHGGRGTLHADEMVGQRADLDVTLFSLSELSDMIREAGFDVVEAHERAPYPEEHATSRLYLWATACS